MMEYLRWILLAAGILFVLVVYFVSRQQRQRGRGSVNTELESDLPEISARDWDDLDEGVGKVRVVANNDDVELPKKNFDADTGLSDSAESPVSEPAIDDDKHPSSPSPEKSGKSSDYDDLVTLYLLAKEDSLSGDKINSAAYANGLVFGKMNIFHRLDDNGEPIYSLANMMEPGYFDPENIHTLKTRGLVLFIQLAQLQHSSEGLHDMLRCAYRMAEMIDARLCNNKRQPLTEKDANAYRELAAKFDD